MKHTIRVKLFLVFAGFMIAFILLGALINYLFLEKFYVYKNKDAFLAVKESVELELQNNPADIKDFIDIIDRSEGFSISIIDNEHSILYSSSKINKPVVTSKITKVLEKLIIVNQNKLDKSYIYTVVDKKNNQAPKLVYIARLNDNQSIILTKPMKGIRESTVIFSEFYLFAGAIIVIISSLCMFLFSKKLVKPIITMSSIAENISNLDFEQKVQITSKDEISQLGESINTISEKLKISIDSFKQDIEFQKQLTRNLSHELKTPVGVIKGYAEGLIYGVAGNPEMADKYCKVIVEECDRMDQMVKELLDLSKLETKGASLQDVTTFPLSSLIRSLLERFATIFSENGITYELDCEETIALTADYCLLERALSNIMINAVKYNNEKKLIRISTWQRGERVTISVYNTGQTIPETDLSKIWDVFYKVDNARSRKTGGHGLGLSIVKSIISLHKGTVTVVNTKDGVEFQITI